MTRSGTGVACLAALAVLVLATAVGLVILRPNGSRDKRVPDAPQAQTESAVVAAVTDVPCRDPFSRRCATVESRLASGPDQGDTVMLDVADAVPEPGDELRLFHVEVPPDIETGPDFQEYALADFERRQPLLWLALAFAFAVIALGRWRGLRALAGLALSLAVVLLFVVPAILDGRSPLAVAVVGALAVMLVTIALAHGIGPKTIAAALGTAVCLSLTVALAVLFTDLAHITGFASEEASLLRTNVQGLSLEGLVLAGMVIAALGVLDDVTVSQASTVIALRHANPAQGFGLLFRRALSVGRDHIAATVNTLVLAYAGAALPILLVFSVGGASFGQAINSEAVAANVVGTLVGSLGLVAAVPVTTALAALLATRLPPDALRDEHAHVH